MKISPRQTLAAYRAINELTHCVFPYAIARKVHTLKRQLSNEFDTVLCSEKLMVADHKGVLQGSQYTFPTPEDAKAFHEEYSTFMDQQDDITLSTVDVSTCLECIRISPETIDALEGLVYFGEE